MEQFLHNNSIFLVLAIALILWFGIALYIFFVDKKVKNLEQDFETINSEKKNL